MVAIEIIEKKLTYNDSFTKHIYSSDRFQKYTYSLYALASPIF